MPREFLGQVRDTGGTTSVYKAAGAFEVDELEGTSGIRRRIFFEDVFLVTYHRQVGTAFVLGLGTVCLLFLIVLISFLADGLKNRTSQSLIGAGLMGALAAPLFAVFLNRVIRKKDVITIFGRHGRARMEFDWRKAKARRVFQDVCKATRNSRPAVRRPRPQAPPGQTSPSDTEPEMGPVRS